MYQVKNVVEKGLQLKVVPVDDEDVSSALWRERERGRSLNIIILLTYL